MKLAQKQALEEAIKNHPFNPGPFGIRYPNMFRLTPQKKVPDAIQVPENVAESNSKVDNRQIRRAKIRQDAKSF